MSTIARKSLICLLWMSACALLVAQQPACADFQEIQRAGHEQFRGGTGQYDAERPDSIPVVAERGYQPVFSADYHYVASKRLITY